MEKNEQMITFTTEDGEKVELFVIEEAKLNGSSYLLVTEEENDDEEDSVAYIMKQTAKEGSGELTYTIVDDEKELNAVSILFEELLDGEVDLVSED